MEKKIKVLIASFIGNKVEKFEYSSRKSCLWRLRKKGFYALLHLLGLTVLPVVKSEEYSDRTGKLTIKDIRQDRTGYTSNVIFNTNDEPQVLIPTKLPDLNLMTFKNVHIHGDSDLVIDIENKCVVNDKYFNLNKRYTVFDGVLYRMRKNVSILRDRLKKTDKVLQSGIVISGKFSKNYYHEVYENLIKLLVIREIDIPSDTPIIVDDVVRKIDSFGKILDYLTEGLGRDVVYIGDRELYYVHVLYYITPINIVTAHLRDRKVVVKEDYVYDDYYIKQLRKSLLPKASTHQFPSKIFISRVNVTKRSFNEEDVLGVIKEYGFELVCPETMTFEEQISLFSNADWIIGGSGAAFSNLVFCKPGCKVLCIVDSVKYGFPIFSTLSYLSDCKMVYYGNEDDKAGKADVHSDFMVDTEKFIKVFKCLETK